MSTVEEIKESIKIRLGGSSLCIELQDADYEAAINSAKDRFAAWWGVEAVYFLQLNAGQSTYDLSALEPRIDEIIEVAFPARDVFATVDIFGGDVYPAVIIGGRHSNLSAASSDMPYSGLLQLMQQIEMMQRVLSADRDWEWSKYQKLLRIMPPPSFSGKMYLKYIPCDFDICQLCGKELEWVKEWARATAKEILGRIRSKFDSIPTPAGDKTLDGSVLLEEAASTKERLRIEIMEMQHPMGFITG